MEESTGNRPAVRAHDAGWALASICGIFLAMLSAPAAAAERDICEHKSGQELIRCIEAAARASGSQAPAHAPAPAPGRAAAGGKPPPTAGTAPPQSPRASTNPQAVQTPTEPREPAGPPAEDCTGRSGADLRHCLAAGGRLSPSAALVDAKPAPAAAQLRAESCEGKTGEALRACVEATAKAAAQQPTRAAAAQVLTCTGYTPADQPLCVHRNTAIAQCRNRLQYPDYDVCLRSYMSRAPEPARADCSKLQSRARAHCDARNQVFQSCAGDKLGYFACLEHRLGADAVLTRR